MVWCQTLGNGTPSRVHGTLNACLALSCPQARSAPGRNEKLAVTHEKHVRKRGESIRQMSNNSVNLEKRQDPSDSSRISSNDSNGNEELGAYYYYSTCNDEPETNTEGNANITVLFNEITERVESKFWSFKKLKTSAGITRKVECFYVCLARI